MDNTVNTSAFRRIEPAHSPGQEHKRQPRPPAPLPTKEQCVALNEDVVKRVPLHDSSPGLQSEALYMDMRAAHGTSKLKKQDTYMEVAPRRLLCPSADMDGWSSCDTPTKCDQYLMIGPEDFSHNTMTSTDRRMSEEAVLGMTNTELCSALQDMCDDGDVGIGARADANGQHSIVVTELYSEDEDDDVIYDAATDTNVCSRASPRIDHYDNLVTDSSDDEEYDHPADVRTPTRDLYGATDQEPIGSSLFLHPSLASEALNRPR